ncbi:hypothetical protein [Saccharothrix obliqua]|uniref:hypothetical protein n=1 Tax=Saccharothrix obliqua TaxID=2861747 RepID=UPI001C5FE84C|nr:hypothetical protein [Saccharothrix obliqua]MBW4720206.1 hypothetical protein [Saccharothrix obliqua]
MTAVMRPWAAATLALGAVTALVVLSGVVPVSAVRAVPARAVLVRLDTTRVPAIGLEAFSGEYGRAISPAPGVEDNGDYSDPDGVLTRVEISTANVRTSASASKNFAQAQLTGMEVHFRTQELLEVRPVVGAVASLDSYAECLPPPIGPLALAYSRTDSAEITVLGRRVGAGTTNLEITGQDIGVDTISRGTITSTVTPHQDPATQSRQSTAEAWLDIRIDGTFTDTSGNVVYQGPVTSVRLGEVRVECEAAPPTTTTTPPGADPPPTDTTAPTTSPPTGPPPTDPTSTPPPTGPPPTGPAPTEPAPTGAEPTGVEPPTGTPPAPAGGKPPLADTGLRGGTAWWVGAGLVLPIAGVAALLVARRRNP